ncbi:hypothetical protein AOLI_G00319640 [Acnodon oligacanthus]
MALRRLGLRVDARSSSPSISKIRKTRVAPATNSRGRRQQSSTRTEGRVEARTQGSASRNKQPLGDSESRSSALKVSVTDRRSAVLSQCFKSAAFHFGYVTMELNTQTRYKRCDAAVSTASLAE